MPPPLITAGVPGRAYWSFPRRTFSRRLRRDFQPAPPCLPTLSGSRIGTLPPDRTRYPAPPAYSSPSQPLTSVKY